MSSLVRRIQLRHRVRGLKPDASRQTKTHFMTCHPTKGWHKISMRRIMLGLGMADRR